MGVSSSWLLDAVQDDHEGDVSSSQVDWMDGWMDGYHQMGLTRYIYPLIMHA